MDSNSYSVQGFLEPNDKCIMCIEAGLVKDWVKRMRILAIVEHLGDFGLLIFVSSRYPLSRSEDLTVENVFPVNDTFRCDIDTSSSDTSAENVYMKISSRRQKLLFELPYNTKAKNFVCQLTKASEAFSVKMGPPSDFKWLKSYESEPLYHESTFYFDSSCKDSIETRSASSVLSLEENFSEMRTCENSSFINLTSAHSDSDLTKPYATSPEFGNLPRQTIASGDTPLAARESAVKLQMTMLEDDYTNLHSYSVFVGTWNVNGQSPRESLADWLASDPAPPDFYAVGFQELDLSTEAFFFTDTPKEEEWLDAVRNGLHPKAQYKMVKLVRLIGMMMIVFVKEEHAEHVKHVESETVGTGIMGKLGNKGGVSVRFDFHRTSMCFVNCHLAAHLDECERRNQDYNDICARITFKQFKTPKFIKDHDQIYWMGDMNYRITEFDSDQVKSLLEDKKITKLLACDQLTIQKNLKKIFIGYSEGNVTFMPTYKYDTGTNKWDSSEKNRCPSWCDRILWKGENVKQIVYRSHPMLLYSDHKPVSSLFESKIKVVDAAKHRKIYEEVMKKLDKLENEFLPQVTLDKLEVNFGKVHFIESKLQTITIANTGQVPVQFEFKKKPNDVRYCKDWLSVKPYSAFIKPGEKCDVDLEVLVDKRIAHKLNAGKEKLSDILVLHLEGGKDVFIIISGTYEPSCFGSSLETLVRIPIPITEIPPARLEDLENQAANNKLKPSEPHFEIPKEIWALVDHLYKEGLKQEGLFLVPGLRTEVQSIREKLDNGYFEFGPCSIHSAAEAFLLFLEAFAEPVIPYKFYYKCLDCSNNFIGCRNVLLEMPKIHQHVFRYIIAFLRELVKYSAENHLDAKVLATLFGSILLREPSGHHQQTSSYRRTNPQTADRKKATFIFHFLMNDMSS